MPAVVTAVTLIVLRCSKPDWRLLFGGVLFFGAALLIWESCATPNAGLAQVSTPLWRKLPPPPPSFVERVARPERVTLPRLPEEEFSRRLSSSPSTLGSVSIGKATRGFLFGGVHMGESPQWHLTDPDRAWGTEEVVLALHSAISQVHVVHPGAHPLHVGHLSRERGGWLRPHRSHQSGRDVDLGFYYTDDSRWYKNADESNLDVARTWCLLSALVKSTEVEYVFVDQSIATLLEAQALAVSEPESLIQAVFRGDLPRTRPVLRSMRGHKNHIHVRFSSPTAVENANRAAARLGRAAYSAGGLLNLLHQKERSSSTRTAAESVEAARGSRRPLPRYR